MPATTAPVTSQQTLIVCANADTNWTVEVVNNQMTDGWLHAGTDRLFDQLLQ